MIKWFYFLFFWLIYRLLTFTYDDIMLTQFKIFFKYFKNYILKFKLKMTYLNNIQFISLKRPKYKQISFQIDIYFENFNIYIIMI